MLAMLHLFPGSTAIYTLPTTSFARQFTRTRVDPVIEASPLLKGMVPADNDSSELKQIGHSFLYVRGSFGQKAAISVPAGFDEHDVPIGAQIVARRGREDLLLRLAAELEGAGSLARS